MKKEKRFFEIRQIDAWAYDDGWNWNESYYMGTMETTANDIKKAFTHYLKENHGITFFKNKTIIDFDGDIYTICDRKTQEPLFAAIPHY